MSTRKASSRADLVLPGGLAGAVVVQCAVLFLAVMPMAAGGATVGAGITDASGVVSVGTVRLNLGELPPAAFADWDQ
jgi:hypothetical protein